MPKAVWVTTALPLSLPPSLLTRSNSTGWVFADDRQISSRAERVAVGLARGSSGS